MDSDYRPHRTTSINSTGHTTNSTTTATTTTTTSELFICFTSRLSSSSMKISSSTSSKSILSPGRSHSTPQISLSSSSSISRRLKNSGSLKGGLVQGSSPMFPNTKKRGCGSNAFENPEPSSPKVTCIGQVRVKTKKKHAKKLRSSRSCSSSSQHKGGEVSFRKLENVESIDQEGLGHRNQRWVHFPVSICEALRSFGADLNCFLPCMNGGGGGCERSKEDKMNGSDGRGHNANSNSNSGSSSSCGAVIARWLVALHDGDGKGREIELVVGEEEGGHGGFGDEEEEEVEVSRRSQRRHIFEGVEFNDEMINKGHEKEDDEEEKGRVSICIPPKNALLLMRCRSDPVKMAALASKFCGSPQPVDSKEDEQEEEDNKDESFEDCVEEEEDKDEKDDNFEACEDKIEEEIDNDEEEEEEEEGKGTGFIDSEQWVLVETQEAESSFVLDGDVDVDEEKDYDSDALEEIIVKQIVSIVREEELGYRDHKGEELDVNSGDSSMPDRERLDLEGKESEENDGNCNDIALKTERETWESMEEEAEKVMEEKKTCEEHETRVKTTRDGSEFVDPEIRDGGLDAGSEPNNQQEKEKPVLPDCLLLMMYEPKLSMEVSKETWVCSTDFVRFLPDRSVGKISSKMDGGDEYKKKVKTECHHPYPALTTQQTRILQQPPRNSCSFPAQAGAPGTGGGADSMAAVIEQKFVSTKAYEPFVLTRCKSEPMRSAIKLAPDACFWKNRKHEPHRSGRIRVKAAGIGF